MSTYRTPHSLIKIGERLNNYYFNDENTEKLFGYNIPKKFFFKKDKNM